MDNQYVSNDPEIVYIKDKLSSMHHDIKRIMEKSNQEYLDIMLSSFKDDFLNAVHNYMKGDIQSGLDKRMVDPCPMRDTCKSLFTEYLEKNALLLREDNVSPEIIEKNRAELGEIRKKVNLENCDTCFGEVSGIFEKQLNLMDSLQIYENKESHKHELSDINEDLIVKDILEPLSNKQRIQILKAMTSESRTFSSLSKLTGLRGGNLLFHIQKLLESDLILQRHERGDYMITKKGFNLLLLLLNIQENLELNK